MGRVLTSRDADFDLLEIWAHIARHNLAAADRLAERFSEVFEKLADSPTIGRSVDWLFPELRRFPVGDYLIFYVCSKDGVVIVRVVHGARDIAPELFE
jgi:toxin ParE1/3/4